MKVVTQVQHPVCLKGPVLTLPYLGVCEVATQISVCLCVALGWTQTEWHCVLNTHISIHRPPREQSALFLFSEELHVAPSWSLIQQIRFFQSVDLEQFNLLKSLLFRGNMLQFDVYCVSACIFQTSLRVWFPNGCSRLVLSTSMATTKRATNSVCTLPITDLTVNSIKSVLHQYKTINIFVISKSLLAVFSLVQSKTTHQRCKNNDGQEEVCRLLAGAVCKERTRDATHCCIWHGRVWPRQHSKCTMMVLQRKPLCVCAIL